MNEKTIKVKTEILELILVGALPISYRLDSLLEDYYFKKTSLSDTELAMLFEFRTAAATLQFLLSDYLEQAREHKTNIIYLPKTEFDLVIELSKTIEASYRTTVAGTALWVH